MATATMIKRTARAHNRVVSEDDEALLGNISLQSVGHTTPTLWGDVYATSITVGGGTRTAAGAGCSISLTGGAPGVAANAGGAVSLTGGAGNTTGAGGAASLVGGAAGATGTGGAVSITTGAGGGTSGNSGALTIDTGTVSSGTTGTITIGGTSASAITMGSASVPVDFDGGMTVASAKAITGDGALTVAATSAVLSLDGTGIETSATTITADAGLAIVTTTTGALTLDSGTTGNVNLGVDPSNAKTVTVGASAGASTTTIDCGTGGLNLGTTANAHTVTLGSTTGAAAVTIQSGTGAMNLTAGGAFDIQATGALTIDSSGAGISIGGDDNDFDIEIGAQGERNIEIGAGAFADTIIIGNTTTGTSVEIRVASGQTHTVTGNMDVNGNLDVQGTLTTVETASLQVTDNYIYLNDGYQTASAQTGGLSVNYLPTATTIGVTTGGFVAAVPSTTDAYVNVTDASSFAASDIIQVHAANNSDNDGIFEVASIDTASTPDRIYIRGVGANSTVEDFSKTDFVTDTNTSGDVHKVNVSIIRAADGTGSTTAGDWEVGKGATTGITYSALGTVAGVTLQTAYAAGNTITMTDANGDFDVSVSSGTPAISLDAAGASNFTVASASLTLSTTTSGSLILTGAGLVDINAGANLDIDVTGTYDMLATSTFSIDGTGASNVTATSGTLTLSTITSGDVSIDSVDSVVIDGAEAAADAVSITASNVAGGVDINAGGTSGAVTIDGGGGISVDMGDASNITVDGGDLVLSTTTSGELDLTSAGLMDVNAGANLDVDVTGTFDMLASSTFSIDGTGASNVSATSGALTVSTITSGDLNLTAADTVVITGAEAISNAVDINASAGGVDIDSVTGWNMAASNASAAGLTLTNTTAETNTTMTVQVANVGATSGNSTFALSVTSTNGSGIIEMDAGDTLSAEVATGGTINVGADAVALTLNLGTGGTGASTVNIGDESVAASAVTIEAGSSGDITFDARGITSPITLNDNTETNLDAGFSGVTSIIGALNFLYDASSAADQVVSTVFATNGGGALAAGSPCRITGATAVSACDADTVAESEVIGFVKTVGAAGSGEVVMAGVVGMAFEAGLTVAVGEVIFLSTTAGRVTNAAPSGSGDTVYEVGVAYEAEAGSTSDGQQLNCVIRLGQRVVV